MIKTVVKTCGKKKVHKRTKIRKKCPNRQLLLFVFWKKNDTFLLSTKKTNLPLFVFGKMTKLLLFYLLFDKSTKQTLYFKIFLSRLLFLTDFEVGNLLNSILLWDCAVSHVFTIFQFYMLLSLSIFTVFCFCFHFHHDKDKEGIHVFSAY